MVGRVSSVEGGSAQVTLITDDSSAISAKVLPSGVQGVIRPVIGEPDELILDYIDTTKPIARRPGGRHLGLVCPGPLLALPPEPADRRNHQGLDREQEASQQVRLRPYADLPTSTSSRS